VTSTAGGKIHVFVEGIGEVVVDSGAVTSRLPVPAPPPPPSPWSGTVTGSVTYVSTVVPGVAGATFGTQMTLGVVRASPAGSITLDGTLNYWRVDPDAPAVNQWGVTLGGNRLLTSRWVLMGRSRLEANRVQYVQYRSTTIAGLGYFVVKSNRVSLLFAPGVGYGANEQTDVGRVLSFAAGIPPGVDGLITGMHDKYSLQLTPLLTFQQDMHYFWGLSEVPFRQAELNAQLVGMVTPHLGLSIAFKDQYDSRMPPPVNRTLHSLVSGLQWKL
jgi:hypothetical protein